LVDREVAEALPRPAPGVLSRIALVLVLHRSRVQVELQLLVDLVRDDIAVKERAEASGEDAKEAEGTHVP
jgi:hypothetical protein